MSMQERDMFVEAADRALLGDSHALDAILESMPARPYLTPVAIANAFNYVTGEVFKVDNVYRWIDAGLFNYINAGSGKEKRRVLVNRESFVAFLKSRFNKI